MGNLPDVRFAPEAVIPDPTETGATLLLAAQNQIIAMHFR
jgi:hypothetical protein